MVNRFAFTGLLTAALSLAACFSSGEEAGTLEQSRSTAVPPIDQRIHAGTETATFALG
jgi:hypothetical protein